MQELRQRLLAGVLLAAAAVLILVGGRALLGLTAALSEGAAQIEVDSSILALPLLGIALAAIGGLLLQRGTAPTSSRLVVLLFALFLGSGGTAIAALVSGPAIMGELLRRHGYVECAAHLGIRTARIRWVSVKEGCGVRNLSH